MAAEKKPLEKLSPEETKTLRALTLAQDKASAALNRASADLNDFHIAMREKYEIFPPDGLENTGVIRRHPIPGE